MSMSFGRAMSLGFSMVGVVAVALTATSCGDSDGDGSGGSGGDGGGGIVCNGGILDAQGNCVAKCDPALCLANNTCVNNQCALLCTSHEGCPAAHRCTPVVEDDTGAAINVCRLDSITGLAGTPCPFGNECDGMQVCPSGEACGASLCGGQACNPRPEFCPPDDPECGLGLCPDEATLCFVQTCPAEECRPMRCNSIGEGDADSFCTYDHCKADADCPGGYYCGVARDPHNICNTSKGTVTPCVDPSQFGAANATFQEGPVSLLKNSCLPRPLCAPCETDLDCSLKPGQVCADADGTGQLRCTETCSEGNTDCRRDFACDTAGGLCRPKFGACIGGGGFCEPCLSDVDCAAGGATMTCRADILVDGQRACHDSAFPDSCTTDTDCPLAPSMLRGECLDAGEGVDPASDVYQKCFFPYNPAPPGEFTCWQG